MKHLSFILVILCCRPVWAAEVIPPPPARYFNDYANVVSTQTAQLLNKQLEDFERQTSNQILVVIYSKMQSDSSLEDYTVRLYRDWKVGLKQQNNGAILFVFVQDHRMRIATGYGLEGALPDAICKRILDDVIAPRFKQGDYDGGLSDGVTAMMAASIGEYKGTGQTVGDGQDNGSTGGAILVVIFIVLFLVFTTTSKIRRYGVAGWIIGSGGGSWGGGFGGGGGGGGGFSGGGGSTGGGGASGSW